MSSLGDAMGRAGRPSPALPEPGPSASPAPGGRARDSDPARSELRARRDALAEQVTELHWDLGGLAYEMAIRDHFRLDVLVRRAATLQERDAQLAEVERLLRLEDSASAGSCPNCAAPHSRGAIFCWQCGVTLMERSSRTPDGASGQTQGLPDGSTATIDAPVGPTTAMMDALLAPANAHKPGGGASAADTRSDE